MGRIDIITSAVVKAKGALHIKSADKDTIIDLMIDAISQDFEDITGRFTKSEAKVEYFRSFPGMKRVRVSGYPIASSPAVVVNYDTGWNWESDTDLDTESYRVNVNTGEILFQNIGFMEWDDALEVEYTGGMAATAEAFMIAFPKITQAALQQIVHNFKSLPDINLSQKGTGTSTLSITAFRQAELLPDVKRVFLSHARGMD